MSFPAGTSGKSKKTIRRHILKHTLEDFSVISEPAEINDGHGQTLTYIVDNNSDPDSDEKSDLTRLTSNNSKNATLPVTHSIKSSTYNAQYNVAEASKKPCHNSSRTHLNNLSLSSVPLDKNNLNFKNDLRKWALDCNIPHAHLNGLLNNVLRKHLPDMSLPKDARTLLKTTRKYQNVVFNGNFCYFGVQKVIEFLVEKHNIQITGSDYIGLAINIDGVPLSKSTDSTFWPLLGNITSIIPLENKVFLIGLFHGKQKPAHPDILLQDFINECQNLNGKIYIQGFYLDFEIKMMICDMPAKSFVLQIKGPTGFYSCTKCVIKGGSAKPICFLEENCEKRTDASFRNKLHLKHHIGISVIEKLNSFDLVQSVPLDYMHLVCLGLVKRLLAHKKYGFVFGKPPYKLRAADVIKLNIRLRRFSPFIPIEFSRRTRNITDCKRYKASEFRTFLLYVGPVVFKNILPKRKYHAFLTLSIAISILIDKRAYVEHWLKYSEELIYCFINECKNLYGSGFFSLNVHSLVHLVDCCRNFGSLDKFSAFPFENFLQSLIKTVRKAHQPLQQIIKRLNEQQQLAKDFVHNSNTITSEYCESLFSLRQSHSEGPLINNCMSPQYKKAVFNHFVLSCNTLANRVVELINTDIFEIFNFCYNSSTEHVVVGRKLNKKGGLFNKPCDSLKLSIFVVEAAVEEDLIYVSMSSILRKLVILPYNEFDHHYVTFPLLHC